MLPTRLQTENVQQTTLDKNSQVVTHTERGAHLQNVCDWIKAAVKRQWRATGQVGIEQKKYNKSFGHFHF